MANFRQQLGAIMDILTKAAVAEIIKLVDDGSAVLRLEMCRTRNENEALKAKMHQMENDLETALGRRDKARAHELSLNTRSVGVQVFEEFKEEKHSKIFGQEMCITAWKEKEQSAHSKDTLVQSLSVRIKPPGVEEESSESCIKQEIHEDVWWSTDAEGDLEANRNDRVLHDHHHHAERTIQTPSKDAEALGEQHQAVLNEQDLCGLQFAMKVEHWKGCAAQKMPEYEPRTGRLLRLTSDFTAEDKDSQSWMSFTQDGCASAGDSSEIPQILSAQRVLSLVPGGLNSCSSTPVLSTVNGRPHISTFESAAENTNLGMLPGHSPKPVPRTQQSRENPCSVGVGATPLSRIQHFGPSANTMAATGSVGSLALDAPNRYGHALGIAVTKPAKTYRKPCPDDKQFRCTHCGRAFSRLTCLKIHQRSHTGEKPYSCVECGRRFTQQKSLKTHRSVHTGERPFSCSLCGKRFSRQDNCTRHERFHSGKKPFSCKQCGKCFTLQSNLKTHQQIHCGFNRLVWAQ